MDKSPFAKVDHIGIIVRDMDKTIEYYESLGMGPFAPVKDLGHLDRYLYGKPLDANRVKLRIELPEKPDKLGQIRFELIQPIEGESPWMEFLQTKGDGMMHIAYCSTDIDQDVAELKERGLEVLYSSRFRNGGGCAYFDARKYGGIIIELVQWSPE